jgi:outer membrane protein assembly factor BamB
MKRLELLFGIVFLGSSGLAASAADWPQWRGPQRNGVSPETGLLKEWPKAGPKLLWQVADIDYGYSTPSVAGDRIYLLSNRGKTDEFVQSLSVHNGKQVWSTRLGKVGPNNYPGARSTPTVDGNFLYALGSDGDLACVEITVGKIVWQKNLRAEFGGKPGYWAYAESPLVDGDVLVCTPGGSQATLVALNKETGATLWKSAVPGGDQSAYASTIVVEAGGRKQYVQFLQKGLVGIDAKNGQFLWRYKQTTKGMANIPTPIVYDGAVYTSGEGATGGLVRLKAAGETVVAEPVYLQRGLPSAIGGAVVVEGHLYGANSKGLLCVDFATGKVGWQDKCVGVGSVCCADGRLFVHGENGAVALVEVTPEAYREKGRFTPPDQPKHPTGGVRAWAYPVVANGRLYIRDLGTLWCYDVQDPRAAR